MNEYLMASIIKIQDEYYKYDRKLLYIKGRQENNYP